MQQFFSCMGDAASEFKKRKWAKIFPYFIMEKVPQTNVSIPYP